MEKMQHRHEDYNQLLIGGIYNQMRKILDSSGQPVFIYLDDKHKVCNQRFAEFLGYDSPQDWSNIPGFLEVLVDDEASKNAFMTAYWSAINNMNASSVQLTLRRKDKTKVKSTMIILPMTYEGHILSVHFITNTQEDTQNQ